MGVRKRHQIMMVDVVCGDVYGCSWFECTGADRKRQGVFLGLRGLHSNPLLKSGPLKTRRGLNAHLRFIGGLQCVHF